MSAQQDQLPAGANTLPAAGDWPAVTLVAAMDRNRVIGVDNRLPWRLPADLKHFRDLTYGHPVIMGRKTFESLRRPLPGRTNVVITRQPNFAVPGCLVVASLEGALEQTRQAPGAERICIIGGAQVYTAAIGLAGRLDLTEVDVAVPRGDTYFPVVDPHRWVAMAREAHAPDAQNPLPYTFVTYLRRPQ